MHATKLALETLPFCGLSHGTCAGGLDVKPALLFYEEAEAQRSEIDCPGLPKPQVVRAGHKTQDCGPVIVGPLPFLMQLLKGIS